MRRDKLNKAEKAFLKDLRAVCVKHNLSISHEDGHGGFLIDRWSIRNDQWLSEATPADWLSEPDDVGGPTLEESHG